MCLYPMRTYIQKSWISFFVTKIVIRKQPISIAFSFNPKVEIYRALSRKTAIIEAKAPDTPGLLYQIAHQLHRKGYDITSASISTQQGISVDTINIRRAIPN